MSLLRFHVSLMLVALGTTTCFAQRNVQISALLRDGGDVEYELFELTNFGSTAVDTSNWQFCLYDSNQKGGCSGAFDAINTTNSIAPGETASIQWSWREPFFDFWPRADANALTIFDLSASDVRGTENMIDHMQWSTDGVHNEIASIYSQQAVDAGLWTSATDWISASPMISQIHLDDSTGGILHGPGDFRAEVVYPPSPCDFNYDQVCDIADMDIYISEWDGFAEEWLSQASWWNGRTYKLGDLNIDGNVDSTDLGKLLNHFGRKEDSLLYSQGNLDPSCCGDSQETINSADLALLLNNFGFTSPEPALAVPESESGAALLLVALGVALRNFKRRSSPSESARQRNEQG